MKQFFRHFGSKARIAAMLPPPTHKIIIEPFAGSAAYSVAHAKPSQSVLLFDTDERVCIIWDYLIHASESDILALPVKHFLDGGDVRDLNLPQAEHLLLKRWMNFSGTTNSRLPPCALEAANGDSGGVWGYGVRAR